MVNRDDSDNHYHASVMLAGIESVPCHRDIAADISGTITSAATVVYQSPCMTQV